MSGRTWKFFSYYRPYLGLLSSDMVCALVVSAATLALPLGANYITKEVLGAMPPNALSLIYWTGAAMVGLVVVHTACDAFVDYQGHMMGARMESDMRRDLMAHLQKQSFGFYDEQKTGQLMSRMTNDLLALAELYHHGPEDAAIALFKLAGVLVILFSLDARLSWLIVLILPPMALSAFYYNRRMNRALRESRERIGDINAQVEDTLAGIRVVQSFTNEAVEQAKFDQANQRFVESRRHGYKNEALFSGGMTTFTQLLTLGVVVLGGAAIVRGTLALGELLTFLLCVGILIEPIQRLVNFARLYQEGLTGFNRFMDLLEVTPAIQDKPGAPPLALERGKIEFRDVSFKYKENYGHVLQNVSLTIEPGELAALIGTSGAGKTTLCSLIPRFYEVSAGSICLDGQNIQEVSLVSLRQQVGLVQQDVYLFSGTVADNIRYGRLDASLDEIVAAAKRANAHEFIMGLPAGYETDIGQRGVKLSGGQKQRLSIARVFLKDPPIIIFDEATSALDLESERAIKDALERLRKNRTTLVIAHRLSTIRNADKIIVLTESGIAEQGTHAELMARPGAYANVYNLQLDAAGPA